MPTAADALRAHQENTPQIEPTVEQRLGMMERQLFRAREDLAQIERRIPGVLTIAGGVLLGMIAYSIVGVIITVFGWGMIISFLYEAGRSDRFRRPDAYDRRPEMTETYPSPPSPAKSDDSPRSATPPDAKPTDHSSPFGPR